MRVGLQIPRFTWPGGPEGLGGRLAAVARTAEEAGFASLWVMDHFFQIPFVGEVDEPMLEGWGALHYLAAATERAKLGTLVSGVTHRPPGLLVKAATTLDVLSGGRAYLGIGAAWFEREHRALGIPFPPRRERFERLEDALRVAKRLWGEGSEGVEGTHHRLEEALCVPPPLSKPHPPILVGGLGERKTLRLVARYGDACNLFTHPGLEVLRHKLAVLDRHCEAEGRDPRSVERTTLGSVRLGADPEASSPADVIRHCEELARLGVDHAIFSLPDVHELAPLERFGKAILPEVAAL